MKINNFRGDLTDISAKKEALFIGSCARWGLSVCACRIEISVFVQANTGYVTLKTIDFKHQK